ncbi:ABC transporter ATP-binding protein [Schaalia sp. lx-100]|uniref:ABC transporter ATP-binding protein n=1 Tax=Schaalia sp. lx-100 TaxID=2899081 RepID=UPI001E438170|nr:ABC transporter ATP-binding protein [Schaalia sp. lx-100]MCD4557476.1 ABC transporter ATP-binding protein/permease [Schaalia sp. lx-100]
MAPQKDSHGSALPSQAAHPSVALRRLGSELAPEKWRLYGVVFFTLVSVISSVAAPSLLGKGTDILFSGIAAATDGATQKNEDFVSTFDFTGLAYVLFFVLVVYTLSALSSWLVQVILTRAIHNAGWRLRDKVQKKIEVLSLSYLDRTPRGDVMSRVSNDIDNITQVMSQTLSQFIQSVLLVIGIIVMMFIMSWKLTVASLVVLPVGMFIVSLIMRRAQPYFRSQWKSTGDLSGIVEETFTGHEVAVLYGLEERFAEEFSQANASLCRSSMRAQFVSSLVMPLMNLISTGVYVVIAVGGGLMVTAGSMSLGGVQAFIQYSRQFMHPLGTLATMASSVQSGIASAERIFEFLDADEMSADTPRAHLPQRVRGSIVFDHVSFSYVPGEPVIKDLSFSVEPGHMVAIIGPTGAGKTTLVNLLMRFYDVDSGRITIDGVDIRDISRDDLRRHVGMVLQDTWLFDGTLAENIAFGRADASHDDVVEAARATAVDHVVRHLPDGYNTHVTDESDALSSGERQLLTIARAFVSQPDLLILDEATSSVDTRTEVLVQQAMDRLRQGRTAFVIAHRLSTIRDADIILVMRDGDVVEMGRHQELLDAEGTYAQLYRASL